MRGHLFFDAGKVSQDIDVVQGQAKVENQFARHRHMTWTSKHKNS